jgi:hypothetical protein
LVEVDNMTPSTKEYIGDVKNLNIFLLNFPIFNSLDTEDLKLIRQNSVVQEFKPDGKEAYFRLTF